LIEDHAPYILNQPEEIDSRIQTFFIACGGREDFLFKGVKDLDNALMDLGIEHTFYVSNGGHDMTNWRKYLFEYARLLF
jgi:enterochelin esterase-like enzyme